MLLLLSQASEKCYKHAFSSLIGQLGVKDATEDSEALENNGTTIRRAQITEPHDQKHLC